MSIDTRRAEAAILEFLLALGHDPRQAPELSETPRRVVAAFAEELLAGYRVDLAALLHDGDPVVAGAGPVLVRDLMVSMVCPHHLTVAWGRADVAYDPAERVLGLGTLSDLVDACCRRLVLQEDATHAIVDALMQHGGARGAYARLRVAHGCLCARGRRQAAATVVTRSGAGTLADANFVRELLGSETAPGADAGARPEEPSR